MKSKTNHIPYEIRISLERVKKLFSGLEEGLPLTYACDLAMIPYQVVQKWVKSYDEYLSSGEEDIDLTKIEPDYDKNGKLVLEKLTTIKAVAVIKKMRAEYLKNINDLLKESKDWQKFAWILERRYRDEYSKEEIISTKAEKVDSIKVVFVDPKQDEDRLKKLEAEVKESIGASID